MNLITILILISSLSFLGYGIAYFISPQMKSEFKRFGLEKVGTLTAVLELLGAVGLLVGLKIHLILLISAGGLALLMFLGCLLYTSDAADERSSVDLGGRRIIKKKTMEYVCVRRVTDIEIR